MCSSCKSRFCFKCGNSYHAPTDCETIRRWLNKCADDSETANYISANTKVSWNKQPNSLMGRDEDYAHFLLSRTVPNAISVLRKTAGAITCSVSTANTTSAGCVSATGELTGQSITSAPGQESTFRKTFVTVPMFRYKENPNIANESAHAQAREALKKYLHYFERVSDC